MRRTLQTLAAVLALLAFAQTPARAWLPDGDPVCTAPEVQNGLVGIAARWPFITSDVPSLVTAWEDHRDASTQGIDLYFSIIEESGTSGSGSPACTAPFDQTHAALAQVDVFCGFQAGCKDVAVTWQDGRGAGGDDIFANLAIGPWASDGVPVCRMSGTQADPAILAVKLGTEFLRRGVVVAWRDGRSGTDDIYAQKLDGDGNRLWDSTGVVVCGAAYNQWNVQIAPGFEVGGALLAWVDQRSFPAPPDLYVQSLDSLGAPSAGWPVDGLHIVTDHATGDLRLLPGGLVVWTEGVDADRRLRATRLLAGGAFAPGWTDSGVAVTPKVGELTLADAALDGGGGLIVSWFDVVERSVTNTPSIALMMQRLGSDGAPATGWAPGGTLVTGLPPDLGGGRLAAQGDGGAIVTWTGPDGGDGGVFAQRVLGTGSFHPWWPAEGVELCAAAGTQSLPVTAATDNGAIVAWLDERNGPATDIYAQFVTAGGSTGLAGVADPEVQGLRLGAPIPNPAAGTVRMSLELPAPAPVSAEVFDMAGRRVRHLGSGIYAAGRHALTWDGRDEAGREVAPGLYLVRASTPAGEARARVVRLH